MMLPCPRDTEQGLFILRVKEGVFSIPNFGSILAEVFAVICLLGPT